MKDLPDLKDLTTIRKLAGFPPILGKNPSPLEQEVPAHPGCSHRVVYQQRHPHLSQRLGMRMHL